MAILENLTIMFTDIVGFSDLVTKLSRAESEKLLQKHDRILNKIIRRFRGKTVKSIGDSFLVVFRSPTDAVLCGMAMQDALWEANLDEGVIHPIVIRVAINAGEVRLTRHDVFGDAVNIASRLEQVTPASAVYLTESVYLAMSKSEVRLSRIDSFQFKGIEEKINVYSALQHCHTHSNVSNTPNEQTQSIGGISYPYGGAHINQKSNNDRRPQYRMFLLFFILLPIVIASTWWLTATFTPVTIQEKILVDYRHHDPVPAVSLDVDILSDEFIVSSHIKAKVIPLLDARDYLKLENLINVYKRAYSNNAYLLLVDGHINTYFKRYENAIESYSRALELDETLANDKLAAKNLITLLKQVRTQTNKLIAKYLSVELIHQLSIRTGQAGLRGRYDAFYLLKDSGNESAIDLVGLNIWDLRELNKCPLKRTAVIELKRLQDERSLLPLQEVRDLGFFGKLKYACLRKDLHDAIALIEKKINHKNTHKAYE